MKKKKIIIVSVVLLLLVGGIGGFLAYKHFTGKEEVKEEASKNVAFNDSIDFYFKQKYLAKNSYFIANNTGLKALFDENDHQLSDFIYETECDFECFLNGPVLVTKDNETGLINKDGKWIVNLGEYEISHLQYNNALFLAVKNETHYLINNEGKVIYTDKEDTIKSFASNYYYVLKNNQFIIYGLDGNVLLKLEKKDDNIPALSYTIDGFANETLVVTYDGKVYFYNLNTGDEIVNYTLENKEDVVYHLVNREYYDFNNDTYILAGYNKDNEILNNLYLKGNKVEYEKDVDTCNKAYYSRLGEAICDNDEDVHFLNNKILKDININKAQYYDKNNYIKEVEDENNKKSVEVYNNNRKVKTIPCASIAFSGKNISKIFYISYQDEETCSKDADKMQFLKMNGEPLFDKDYYEIRTEFDVNKLAVVADKEEAFYLIDNNGNRISSNYEDIGTYGKYYVGMKDNKEYLLDVNGKELLEADSFELYLINGEKLFLANYDTKTKIYNFDNLELAFEVNDKLVSGGHYLVSNHKTYYNTKGEVLYDLQNIDRNENEAKTVTVYVFRGEGCPHCEEALEFLSGLQEKYSYLKVVSYEVWKNEANSDFHNEVIEALNLQIKTSVPLIIIGDDYIHGFSSSNSEALENKIKSAYEDDNYTDKVGELSKATDLKIEPEQN